MSTQWVPSSQRDIPKIISIFNKSEWTVEYRKGHYVATPPRSGMKITFPSSPSDHRWGLNFITLVRRHPDCPEGFKRLDQQADEILRKGNEMITETPTPSLQPPAFRFITKPGISEALPQPHVRPHPFSWLALSGKASFATNSGKGSQFTIRLLENGGAPGSVPEMPVFYDVALVDDKLVLMESPHEGLRYTARRTAHHNFGILTVRGSNRALGLVCGLSATVVPWVRDGESLTFQIPAKYIASNMIDAPQQPAIAPTPKPETKSAGEPLGGVQHKTMAETEVAFKTITAEDIVKSMPFETAYAKTLLFGLNQQIDASGGKLEPYIDSVGKVRCRLVTVVEL